MGESCLEGPDNLIKEQIDTLKIDGKTSAEKSGRLMRRINEKGTDLRNE